MRALLFSTLLMAFLFLALPHCSTDNVRCGDTTCGSGEVCESGQCVLALNISGEPLEEDLCFQDEDCPDGQICTLETSTPAQSCIPRLECEQELDCQSGLSCGPDGYCQ